MKLEIEQASEQTQEPTYSISTVDMPILAFAQWVTDTTGDSIVISEKLDNKHISIEIRNKTITEIVSAAARRIGVDVLSISGIHFLGEARVEDRAILTIKVSGLSTDEIREILTTIQSPSGKFTVTSNGIAIIADKVEIITRANQLFRNINQTPQNTWIIQAHIIDDTMSHQNTAGMTLDTISADLAYTLATSSNTNRLALTAQGKALLTYHRSLTTSKIIAEPLIIISPGQPASIKAGTRTPIPLRTVSNEGTVSTTGFQYLDTGLILDANIIEAAGDKTILKLDLELSTIEGFIEHAPITSRRYISSTATMQSGGIYIFSAIDDGNTIEDTNGLIGKLTNTRERKSTLYVWIKTYRIGKLAEQKSEPESD